MKKGNRMRGNRQCESPVILYVPFPPAVLSVGPFLEDVRFRACLNWATPRTTLRSLVHMKRPLRFLLGHGLSKAACRGDRQKDEDMRR